MRLRLAVVLAPLALLFGAQAAHADDAVAPIDWSAFQAGQPNDPPAITARRVLLNTARHALTTWFPERYGDQAGQDYLSFKSNNEDDIRQPASEALALAAIVKLGIHDQSVVGRPEAEAAQVARRLTSSLAFRHLANAPGGWGNHWQSALWSSYAGMAGWLLWDDLAPADRERVRRMVEFEADRFVGYRVPYYRNAQGQIISPGNTHAEENAWNSALLSVATAIMPDHPRRRLWMDKNVELMVSAFSRPSDVGSGRIVNGKPLSEWLDGSNANQDGTVENHNLIHPDYMTTTALSLNGALAYALAGMPTPTAATFNANVVYDAFVDLRFASPPFQAPGGTMYIDGSGEMYYPMGTDWGRFRALPFALVDVQAGLFGLDEEASTPAERWERLHMGRQLQLQSRFTDGRTWGDFSEFRYAGREQFAAVQAAQVYLFKWLARQGALAFTDRAFPLLPQDTVPQRTSLTLEGPSLVQAGERQTFSARLTNDAEVALTDVSVELEVPEGWPAPELIAPIPRTVPPGGSATVRWSAGPPEGQPRGRYQLRAHAGFRALGGEHTEVATTAVVVPSAHAGTETPGLVGQVGSVWRWTLVDDLEAGSPDHVFDYGPTSCAHRIPGDWDGDGSTSPGIVCASNGEWRWRLSNANAVSSPAYDFRFGPTSCTPVAGDWDADGTTTPGIVCPDGDAWLWRLSNVNATGPPAHELRYGAVSAAPVVGDWNGDGRDTIGVAKPEGALRRWQLRDDNSAGPATHEFLFGAATGTPVAGDWDGDRVTTAGSVEALGGELRWRLLAGHDAGAAVTEIVFGSAGQQPIAGDWDGE